MAIEFKDKRRRFAKSVLTTLSPEDVPLFEDLVDSVDGVDDAAGVGTEFGVETLALLGPVAVLVAQKVFDEVASWVGKVALKTTEDVISKQAQEAVKKWLASPEEKAPHGAFTDKGRAELLGLVEELCQSSKLPREQVDQLREEIARRLFVENS